MAEAKGNILVVDDNITARLTVSKMLMRKGFEVETAQSGEEALEIIEQRPFDLVLSDLQMDGMDGTMLLEAIKTRWPETRVVILTAFGTTDSVIDALRKGVSDYLLKPCPSKELIDVVEREVTRKQQLELTDVVPRVPDEMSAPSMLDLSSEQLDHIDSVLAELRAEVSAQAVLLIEGTGYLVSSKGTFGDLDISSLAALVAGGNLASAHIAAILGEADAFKLNYHEGKNRNLYLANVGHDVFLVIIFDKSAKMGTVWYYAKQSTEDVAEIIASADFVPVSGKEREPPSEKDKEEVPRLFSMEQALADGLIGNDFASLLSDKLDGLMVAGD